MSGDELLIGGIRAQSNRLKQILVQMETNERWKDHVLHYANELREIEKGLRKIRKEELEHIVSPNLIRV